MGYERAAVVCVALLLFVGCAVVRAASEVCPEGFAQTYEITGCADPAHCGVYRIVPAHCEPGAHCPTKSDRSLCDRAPVYQLEGRLDGPVLHRYNYGDLTTRWFVGDAQTALAECDHQ